jgi:hypothetical protein
MVNPNDTKTHSSAFTAFAWDVIETVQDFIEAVRNIPEDVRSIPDAVRSIPKTVRDFPEYVQQISWRPVFLSLLAAAGFTVLIAAVAFAALMWLMTSAM